MEFRALPCPAVSSSAYSTVGKRSKAYQLWCILLVLCLSCKDREKILVDTTIISFTITNTNIEKVSINHTTGIIEINVPYGTLLSNKFPSIQISEGASIIPSSRVPQDFSKAVYYTVSAPNGSKKVYKVVVSTKHQPNLSIESISKDTIQAGDTVFIFGEYFGPSISLLAISLISPVDIETKISARLIDSTQLWISTPSTLQPGDYRISITRNNLKAISTQLLHIRIPKPEITDLKRYNLLQGDTLLLAGNYITNHFKYGISLLGEGSILLHPFRTETGKLSVVIGSEVLPGSYEVFVDNLDEKTNSLPFAQKLRVYSNKLPFVTGILANKSSYSAGETAVFKTLNFQSLPARFYSVQLVGQNGLYNQNGIYNSTNATLSIVLPHDIPNSTYAIQITFLDSSGNRLYELFLDNQLIVNP